MSALILDDEDDDELEPLFSYKRVCRPPSDDDSDDDTKIINGKSWPFAAKRGDLNIVSSSKMKVENGLNKRNNEADVISIEDDDDNWLPSPPKAVKILDETKIYNDPMLREIREQREELARLTASSESALKRLGQDESLQRSASGKSDVDFNDGQQEACPARKKEKVQVSIQNKDGVCKVFRVYKAEKFEKLFHKYAESNSVPLAQLIFMFDGQKISAESTPADLEIEDEDIIEVNLRT